MKGTKEITQEASAVTVLSNTTVFKQAAFSFKALTLPSSIALATVDPHFGQLPRIAVADFNRDGKMDFVMPADPGFGPKAIVILLRYFHNEGGHSCCGDVGGAGAEPRGRGGPYR